MFDQESKENISNIKSENSYKNVLSWKDLNLRVSKVSYWMKSKGLKKGDRVAAYLPNIPETVTAYLSSSAIGAIWSSCSPDFGIGGVVDRFSQIKPKILFIGDEPRDCKAAWNSKC